MFQINKNKNQAKKKTNLKNQKWCGVCSEVIKK